MAGWCGGGGGGGGGGEETPVVMAMGVGCRGLATQLSRGALYLQTLNLEPITHPRDPNDIDLRANRSYHVYKAVDPLGYTWFVRSHEKVSRTA